MIICVIGIDLEGLGELSVALLTLALFVTLEWLASGATGIEASCETLDFLLSALTFACDKSFGLAGLFFFAGKRGMALVKVVVAARLARLTTWLRAVGTRNTGILTVTSMAEQFAEVGPRNC